MKPRYQSKAKESIEQFQQWARGNARPVQLSFPTPDVAALAEQGLGELLRRVGKLFIETVMEAEADEIAGPRSKPSDQRRAYRWGTESGYCVVDGQKVPLARPRLRSKANNEEIPLGSYELFQRSSLMEETVWHKIMHGLSMRSYKEVVQQFADAYGLNKSTVSEHFIEASRKKLEQLLTRSLANVSICVMMIDGTIFKGANLIVAIGIDRFGHKIVLGLRQGATENAAVVGELLSELAERGLNFTEPRLYVLDGGKGIRRAIRDHAGDAAFFQRCQVHKIRNVCAHLPDAQQHAVRFQMRAAYEKTSVADAKQALYHLHDQLLQDNPSAAASLAEGLDETLTVICRQVKRWQGSDHRLRWVASAISFAESRWNRLAGYRHIGVLVTALKTNFELRLQQQNAALRRNARAA